MNRLQLSTKVVLLSAGVVCLSLSSCSKKGTEPEAIQVTLASAGGDHSMVLKEDGSLWAMGVNGAGELGDGTRTNRHSPVQVMTGVSSVSAGGLHTMVLKVDGSLWAMGHNGWGQLGDGTTSNRHTPVQVMTGVSSVSASERYTMFIKDDGSLWAMG